ncbi:sulfurtransferase [Psychroserpens sp.]|jgi:thiosulfate/3-mercaptopyruvate sulfurtransferase|uniref:sulfurtransferase n=1 Tax=Psychroserpens sp. TaxID=2020870 RepID=UPI0039E6B61A
MHRDNSTRTDKSRLVSVEWLHENLKNDNLVILDATIRKVSKSVIFSSEKWIPKTRYFDLKGKFSDTEAEFPTTLPSIDQFQKEARALGVNQDSIIVVYDTKGIYSSPRVWWLFKTFGFENVAVLDGGLPEWKQLNYKTVTSLDTPSWSDGDFIASYKPQNIRFFNAISEISTDEDCLILDARSAQRFQGEIEEPRAGLRSGTIPNSENLPYTDLLDRYCLKSKEDLKSIFNTFKLENKSLTFSCGSGITACILALAADILNYNELSVYDGSWTEYGTLTT